MENMTPSIITAGQIGKIQELLGAGLRKSGLMSEPTQQVLEHRGDVLVSDLVAVVQKFVEEVSNMITRRVTVNRNRTPEEAINATGRKKHIQDFVVATMPKGEGNEVEVIFFKVGKYVSDADLENEYDLRGLKPADPYSLSAVNEADPAFADSHPNCTHWKDTDKWCYIAFSRWFGVSFVRVGRDDGVWDGIWWFAGLRVALGLVTQIS